MRTILTAAALMIAFNSFAQKAFDTATDYKNGSLVLKGQVTFDDLLQEKSFGWMQAANSYKPNARAMDFLKQNLSGYRIIVFMGTWCSDSHELIPRLYKVLTAANFPMGELTMYGVDRTKATKDGANSQFQITAVPTIILLRNGKEAGRITETVRKTVEKDLVKIIERDK
jgi:thiol-disulfide isomerase/thioredoxin